MGMEKIAGFYVPSPGAQVHTPGFISKLPQKSDPCPVTGSHIQPAAARGQKRQFNQIAAVFQAAGMALHYLSSRAFSTESTLPRASSSGT